MLQLTRWLITLGLIFFIVLILGFVKFTQIKAAIAFGESFPETNETVQAVKQIQWSKYQDSISLVGEVKAIQSVQISNEVEGILTALKVRSGAKVTKGDLLLQFNSGTELAQLEAINAQIELAKLEVKRFTDLLDLSASSKEALDRAKAELLVANARAKEIQSEIDKLSVYAPINGIVSIHDWQVGTYIPASTELFVITGLATSVWIDFKIPQNYADISLGTALNVSFKSKLATGTEPQIAELITINQEFNTSSRTLSARAKLNQAPSAYRPGAIVSIKLPYGLEQDVIALPKPAIRYDSFGSYVFVLETDKQGNYRAKRTAVNLITSDANTAYVLEGVKEGQIIATIGSAKLRPNMLTYISDAE